MDLRRLIAPIQWSQTDWLNGLSDGELERELGVWCRLKRLCELRNGDPVWRGLLATDPAEALRQFPIGLDANDVAPLLRHGAVAAASVDAPHATSAATDSATEVFGRFLIFLRDRLDRPDFETLAGKSSNPRYHSWRERQRARLGTQLRNQLAETIPHILCAFELQNGCSVGCWFCAVAAPSLGDMFPHTDENARLYRGILEVLRDLFGEAAGAGTNYWATDPLDNPDYERFCEDYHDVNGVFPQTTTALALRDPARTRRLLALANERGCGLNRFSVYSLKQLHQVFAEFSPEELAYTHLVTIFRQSEAHLTIAGRAREGIKKRKPEAVGLTGEGTIACASGFLFNMVNRTVRLISPCASDDAHPTGYITFAEGTFADAAEARDVIMRMVDEHMPATVLPERAVAFRPDLDFSELPDGFQLSNRFARLSFRGDAYYTALGRLVAATEGAPPKTAGEVASLLNVCGIAEEHTYGTLAQLLARGVLDEEPRPGAASAIAAR